MKMDKIIKQAQRMQAQMALAQEELQNAVLEGAAGGGAVKATANGHGDILSITIDKEVEMCIRDSGCDGRIDLYLDTEVF